CQYRPWGHPLTTRGPSCTMDCGSSKIEEGLQAHCKKTSPRFTVNWPALASSTLEDSGPVFTNRRCGAISPVRSVPDPPASTAPRAREGIKTHARTHDEGPDDMPAHIKSALTQTQLSIPVTDGRLQLGTWQGIFLRLPRFRGRLLAWVITAPLASSPHKQSAR